MLRILIYVTWQLVTSSHFFLEVLVTFFVGIWKENQSQNVGRFQCKRMGSTLVPFIFLAKVLMKAYFFSCMNDCRWHSDLFHTCKVNIFLLFTCCIRSQTNIQRKIQKVLAQIRVSKPTVKRTSSKDSVCCGQTKIWSPQRGVQQ